jgi:hypothetical protein
MTANIVVLQPLIALIAGTLILIMPRLLNCIVAIYLILIGSPACGRISFAEVDGNRFRRPLSAL